jgi:hypothetical protein
MRGVGDVSPWGTMALGSLGKTKPAGEFMGSKSRKSLEEYKLAHTLYSLLTRIRCSRRIRRVVYTQYNSAQPQRLPDKRGRPTNGETNFPPVSQNGNVSDQARVLALSLSVSNQPCTQADSTFDQQPHPWVSPHSFLSIPWLIQGPGQVIQWWGPQQPGYRFAIHQ